MSLDSKGRREAANVSNQHVQFFAEKIGEVTFEMVEIPEGSFQMGISPLESEQLVTECKRYCKEPNCEKCDEIPNSESPRHEVKVRKFYISRTEVSQAQWEAVRELNSMKLPGNPSAGRSDPIHDAERPVEQVSWFQAQTFCNLLSQKTGRTYRLPTEAEWEYACRGGAQTPFALGETINGEDFNYDADRPYGLADKKPNRRTTKPETFITLANAFGLYHLHGNVAEWCEDTWSPNYSAAPKDGSAWVGKDEGKRVVRGGSWSDPAYACRCAARQEFLAASRRPSIGFRVVMELQAETLAPPAKSKTTSKGRRRQ